METEGRLVVVKGWGEGEQGVTAFWGDENVLESNGGNGCSFLNI